MRKAVAAAAAHPRHPHPFRRRRSSASPRCYPRAATSHRRRSPRRRVPPAPRTRRSRTGGDATCALTAPCCSSRRKWAAWAGRPHCTGRGAARCTSSCASRGQVGGGGWPRSRAWDRASDNVALFPHPPTPRFVRPPRRRCGRARRRGAGIRGGRALAGLPARRPRPVGRARGLRRPARAAQDPARPRRWRQQQRWERSGAA